MCCTFEKDRDNEDWRDSLNPQDCELVLSVISSTCVVNGVLQSKKDRDLAGCRESRFILTTYHEQDQAYKQVLVYNTCRPQGGVWV